MQLSYNEFVQILNNKIKSDDEFYYELLKTIIKNPNRYTGIFRISNAKTKLMQNVTQSREIKFGDFMEDIITKYIEFMGYENLNKNIGQDEEGNNLNADQIFKKNNTIFLIEQKIRDDHDSTKKRGQYQNFQKKYMLLKKTYNTYNISASMWFIDDSLSKNKKYYLEQTLNDNSENISLNIFYGKQLFTELFNREEIWIEICTYLSQNKEERSNEVLLIPDFNTSSEINNALIKLKSNEPNLYKKLISNKDEYIQLRKELFSTNQILLNDI